MVLLPTDVFVEAGQSNAEGGQYAFLSDTNYLKDARWQTTEQSGDWTTLFFRPMTRTWDPLDPENGPGPFFQTGKVGLSLCTLAQLGTPYRYAKKTEPGTNMDEWLISFNGGEPLIDTLILICERLLEMNFRPIVQWTQGEADGDTRAQAGSYFDNLTEFKSRLPDSALFLVTMLSASVNKPFGSLVRDAQARWKKEHGLTLDPDKVPGFELGADGLHYSPSGLEALSFGWAKYLMNDVSGAL